MSEISIAAVVPMIGRDSLQRAIDSILEQSHPVSELEVVNPQSLQQFAELGAQLTRGKSARDLIAKSSKAYADSAFDFSAIGDRLLKSRFSHRPRRQVRAGCGLSSVVPCALDLAMLWMVGNQNRGLVDRPVVPAFASSDQSSS